MYFKLIIESGHLGAGKSLETVRYFTGDSLVEIFQMAARTPRTKGKDKGTGVKLVQSVTRDEYMKGLAQAGRNAYLGTRKKSRKGGKKKEVLFH